MSSQSQLDPGNQQQQKTTSKPTCTLPFVDQFIMEMNERFNHSNNLVLKGVSACSPSSSVFLDFKEMKPFCLMYGIDVNTL